MAYTTTGIVSAAALRHMNIILVSCIDADILGTGKLPVSRQARRTKEVSATEDGASQMPKQKRHHCPKILDPAALIQKASAKET